MNSLTDNVLLYARHIYGAQMLYRNRVVYLKTEDDVYRIDIHLAHKNIFRFHSMTYPMVFTDTNLARGIFRMAAHKTYKEIEQIPSNKDWERFVNDAYAYVASLKNKESKNEK